MDAQQSPPMIDYQALRSALSPTERDWHEIVNQYGDLNEFVVDATSQPILRMDYVERFGIDPQHMTYDARAAATLLVRRLLTPNEVDVFDREGLGTPLLQGMLYTARVMRERSFATSNQEFYVVMRMTCFTEILKATVMSIKDAAALVHRILPALQVTDAQRLYLLQATAATSAAVAPQFVYH